MTPAKCPAPPPPTKALVDRKICQGFFRHVIFVGEEIATRKNDRGLITDRGQMVRNRAEWTVRAIRQDLSITVEGASGTVRLPSEYVAEHVDLAYARTEAGAQGRTVDVGINRPALARQAKLNKPTNPSIEIERSRRQSDSLNSTRQILDRWAGRTTGEQPNLPRELPGIGLPGL